MNIDLETAAVLRKASEDYAGLWELPIALRSVGIPDAAPTARRVAARLFAQGLIYAVWGDPSPRESSILSAAEWQQSLVDDSLWDETTPYAGRTVWVSATDDGDRVALNIGPLPTV